MAKASPRNDPKTWCSRCQERDASPDPKLALLNPKHEMFCRNLTLGKMTGGKAYMEAGFATKNKSVASASAQRLKQRIEITNRIEALLGMTLEHDVKTAEWVDERLKELADRCMQAKPHCDRNGKPDGQWYFDPANANKALYAMGKDRGMFVDKLEVTNPADAALAGKSPQEVLEVVEAAAIDLGRDFIKQLGEKVGLQFTGDGEGVSGAPEAPAGPLPSLH